MFTSQLGAAEQKSPEKRSPADKQLLNIPGMSNKKTEKTYDYYKQISELHAAKRESSTESYEEDNRQNNVDYSQIHLPLQRIVSKEQRYMSPYEKFKKSAEKQIK